MEAWTTLHCWHLRCNEAELRFDSSTTLRAIWYDQAELRCDSSALLALLVRCDRAEIRELRPTTAVRILAGGSGTDYDGRYLASNTTSPYDRITKILTEFITQDSLEDRRALETLFFISEDDQLIRTLGYSGDSLRPAPGYLGGSPADVVADRNKKELYVRFEDTKNQAELDDKNEAFVQCIMSIDPAIGQCPVPCNILGALDTTRPTPSSSYERLRYWALYRANDPAKPAIALYSVTPPASG
ncbi:unnamed protein product [Zymoseptoria tritici ST99CH_1A5]|uniref:Uncharacterized protein n=1 Tax=Zymoseptoria tritici ST99CH_1A5 TaxID=1276529 RepID=A0A1Y6LMY7_ZYMTR|nr:unnamed protein product [Zymoseptoria tritici ST99CH_1A5]